jgi:hypothetical protein
MPRVDALVIVDGVALAISFRPDDDPDTASRQLEW